MSRERPKRKKRERKLTRVINYYIQSRCTLQEKEKERNRAASRGTRDDADDALRSFRRFVRMSNVEDVLRAPVSLVRVGNVGKV